MQYHALVIIIYRPFLSSYGQTVSLRPEDVSSSRVACTEAANAINALVRLHRRLYTLKRINLQAVHLIFAAAMIHLGNAVQPKGSKSQTELDTCCQALCEMGSTFKSSSRALEIVLHFKTELLARSRDLERPSPGLAADLYHGMQHAQKKPRYNGVTVWDGLESGPFSSPGFFTFESFDPLYDLPAL